MTPVLGSAAPGLEADAVANVIATPHRIDVHHHFFPERYMKEMAERGISAAGDVHVPDWTPEKALAMMDRNGIETAIASIAAPGVYFGDRAAARALARHVNEYAARLVSDHPQRFGAFASLPLPDVDAALEEISYSLDTLRLDGVNLLSNVGGTYLGDQEFDAVFAELNRRKAVVFIHPEVSATSRDLKLALPGALVEFVFDTTRAVANLIYSGTLERYPDISIILPHAGGTVPFLSGRLALGELVPALKERAPKGAIAYLRRLYYETALSTAPCAMGALRELVDPSHILYGSDNPFLPEPLIGKSIETFAAYNGFTSSARRAIERDSALALFPRLNGN